jgi:hypothetical protein
MVAEMGAKAGATMGRGGDVGLVVGRTLVLILTVAAEGCAHSRTATERLSAAGALEAAGEYEKALFELRAVLSEPSSRDAVAGSVVHLRIAEVLLALGRTKESASEARTGLTMDSGVDPSLWWVKALVLLDSNNVAAAAAALRQAVTGTRVDVTEFARAAWLAPLRALPSYRGTLASVLLNARRVEPEELQWLNAAGGINIQPLQALIAAPERLSGACSLAVVQLREPFASTPPQTRVVGELVSPRLEGTGVEFQKETVTTEVDTSFTGVSDTTHRSSGGVYWGSSFLSASGRARSTIRTEETVPTTLHSVVLNPQGLFAVYQYDGLDQALLQNRVAVVFACQREIAQLPRGALQQQRAPVLDVVAYSPFEAGGLPIRRNANESVLTQ